MSYVFIDLGSSNGLVSPSAKPLPELIFKYQLTKDKF